MIKLNYKYYLKLKYYNKIYNLLLNKLIKRFFKKGYKDKGLKFLFNLKYLLKKTSKIDSNFILLYSLIQSIVKVYFIKKRFGKVYKDIPMPLLNERQIRFVVKDYFKFSKSNKSRKININNLNNLILLTCKKKGKIIKKNFRIYKKALDSRVFLSLRKK